MVRRGYIMLMFLTGKDISKIRQARGLTLKQFADLLGVTEAAVSRWEADKRRPRYDMMEKLNDMLPPNRLAKSAAAS